MDFLLGNPFSSPVGQRIEKATDGSLQSEDWALNMEICDIINETEEGPKDAFRALKKRIVGNKNFHEVMLALTVLETCVKNCGHRFHVLVASQEFVECVLVRTILPKNNPPTTVHDKVLTLIQSWADAFRSSPDLTGVVAVYEDLRRKGLEFPMTDLDMLSPIHTPQRTVFNSETSSGQNSVGSNNSQRGDLSQHATPLPTPAVLPGDSPITPTPEQIGKLRSELEMVSGNVRVMSEMLTELVPTQVEPADLELLQELNRTCRAMQQRVLELIPRISNEQLTEELLMVNDNLNNVFLRHERFERFRTGQTAKASSDAELAADLIDMGPDSTATSNLSSQLAGMKLGSRSVRAGLQSLETSGHLEDDFDMFALTRGSSLADQRKGSRPPKPVSWRTLSSGCPQMWATVLRSPLVSPVKNLTNSWKNEPKLPIDCPTWPALQLRDPGDLLAQPLGGRPRRRTMTCCLPYECRIWHPVAQGLALSYPLGPFPPLVLLLLGGVLLPHFSPPGAWAAVG
ncbi:target of Myb1 membrane trafficking protein isoform X1 [Psammomys obesus]|uniref:target of Myb1 membrane trafficking protein isoform X1 n=1 Tax=Psammomys obesus TaxID=48139 RepID=UPI002452B55F|nr:target of Myb1 membrane trafficking protein isoform X1 [Psammomys obesus]